MDALLVVGRFNDHVAVFVVGSDIYIIGSHIAPANEIDFRFFFPKLLKLLKKRPAWIVITPIVGCIPVVGKPAVVAPDCVWFVGRVHGNSIFFALIALLFIKNSLVPKRQSPLCATLGAHPRLLYPDFLVIRLVVGVDRKFSFAIATDSSHGIYC